MNTEVKVSIRNIEKEIAKKHLLTIAQNLHNPDLDKLIVYILENEINNGSKFTSDRIDEITYIGNKILNEVNKLIIELIKDDMHKRVKNEQ